MKAKEKRVVKGYKVAPTPYAKAMKRARKEKVSLATLIEKWVACYGAKMPFYIDPNPTEIYFETGSQLEAKFRKYQSLNQ